MVINQKDLIVISTKDALLIMPNDKNVNIKDTIQNLSKKNNEKVLFHPNVYRPWGSFEVLLTKKNYQVKKKHGYGSKRGFTTKNVDLNVDCLVSKNK